VYQSTTKDRVPDWAENRWSPTEWFEKIKELEAENKRLKEKEGEDDAD